MHSDNSSKTGPDACDEYLSCVSEMLENSEVRSMRNYAQHRHVDCLKHCLNVSYTSFLICRLLGLNSRAAARGGLLHDFFLYDWHEGNPYGGLHGFTHPGVAAENAERRFDLTDREKDVIKKHMWPLTLSMPKYPESYVVILTDKFFCVAEAVHRGDLKLMRKLLDKVY